MGYVKAMGLTLMALGATEVSGQDYTLRAPLPDSARTEVLVLGTPHLRALGDNLRPSLVASLSRILVDFAPDAIVVEAMPGTDIAHLVRAAAEHPAGSAAQLVEAFVGELAHQATRARVVLGVPPARAHVMADSLLDHEPPDATTRCTLVLALLAAYEAPSAVLHWSRLPDPVRRTVCDRSPSAGQYLESLALSANEIYAIALPLADRLGHDRLFGFDDHSDDAIGLESGTLQGLATALPGTAAYQNLTVSDWFAERQTELSDAAATGDLLALYRRVNTPAYLNADVDAQWHLFFRTHLPSGVDRVRAGLWEARNLRMAAHLRAAPSLLSARRLLVIVGAAHKPFLDQYLRQMMDVEVVQLADVEGR